MKLQERTTCRKRRCGTFEWIVTKDTSWWGDLKKTTGNVSARKLRPHRKYETWNDRFGFRNDIYPFGVRNGRVRLWNNSFGLRNERFGFRNGRFGFRIQVSRFIGTMQLGSLCLVAEKTISKTIRVVNLHHRFWVVFVGPGTLKQGPGPQKYKQTR